MGFCFHGLVSRSQNERNLNNWQQYLQQLPPAVQDAFYDTVKNWKTKYQEGDVLKSWRVAMNDSLMNWNQGSNNNNAKVYSPLDIKRKLFNLRLSEKRPEALVLTYWEGNEWVCHLCFLDKRSGRWKLETKEDESKNLNRFLRDKELYVPLPHPNILRIFSYYKINVDTYL